ncbi:hypothetical protein KSP40_PGU003238 [Platanthera guangdongensis]|uniref:Uncharacterized protein n=1 Tax=Platanthera guangdongensis TaxID=2320717 RepID=A0ABR2MKH3_9ASPA
MNFYVELSMSYPDILFLLVDVHEVKVLTAQSLKLYFFSFLSSIVLYLADELNFVKHLNDVSKLFLFSTGLLKFSLKFPPSSHEFICY